MSNLFHMHIYRASKAKSTKVIAVLLLVFFAITMLLAYVFFENPFDFDKELLDVLSGVNGNGTVPYRIHSFFTQMAESLLQRRLANSSICQLKRLEKYCV